MTIEEAKQKYLDADKKDGKKWQAVCLYMTGSPIMEIGEIVATEHENVRHWIAVARKGARRRSRTASRRAPPGYFRPASASS